METPDLPRPDRRTAIKWLLTAAGALALRPETFGFAPFPAASSVTPAGGAARGYGTDPDLIPDYHPGELWPLTFTDAQRRTAAALCAVIIPADERSPSAASLGVHDFIDEWISAPYPAQRADRVRLLEGLAWIDAEARRRFGRDFAELDEAQAGGLCADICDAERVAPALKAPAAFFARFRDLTAGGFYTTPAGMKDIGYVGNVPLARFDGPPPEVLRKLGLG